jgi:hypothetical protein
VRQSDSGDVERSERQGGSEARADEGERNGTRGRRKAGTLGAVTGYRGEWGKAERGIPRIRSAGGITGRRVCLILCTLGFRFDPARDTGKATGECRTVTAR